MQTHAAIVGRAGAPLAASLPGRGRTDTAHASDADLGSRRLDCEFVRTVVAGGPMTAVKRPADRGGSATQRLECLKFTFT